MTEIKKGNNIENKDLVCVECTKVFKSVKKLNRHFKEIHLKIFAFQCDVC